jgi:hypothetical protein
MAPGFALQLVSAIFADVWAPQRGRSTIICKPETSSPQKRDRLLASSARSTGACQRAEACSVGAMAHVASLITELHFVSSSSLTQASVIFGQRQSRNARDLIRSTT